MEVYSSTERPTNVNEYIIWANEKLGINFEGAETYYTSVSKAMKEQFEKSDYWKAIIENIKITQENYLRDTKYELLQRNFKPIIYLKEYTSFLDKCFRKNVLINKDWPEKPEYGWINHLNCYEKLGDVIRTNFIVKYLDGIEYVIQALNKTCQEFGREYVISYEARENGYYAVHYDLLYDFEIPTFGWKTQIITGRVEIQITTQLKDVIKLLTHNLYKEKRVLDFKIDKWQWDYKSNEFIINYLGHILHYLEGTIMEIRDRR